MDIERIAHDLMRAYAAGDLIPLPSERGPLSLAQAYAIGEQLTAWRRAHGERTIGRKIGFTNRALWEPYGVDRPLWAHMYDSTVSMSQGAPAQIAIGGMVAPRIETELVIGLAEPVATGASIAELMHTVAWVALGFEIVDCHFADWRFTIVDCTADFGLHAGLVVGQQHWVGERERGELATLLEETRVALRRDGEPAADGVGANALGSPLLALGFLAEAIDMQRAEPLQAGEIVTTGTLTPALPIAPGETWRATSDWAALGALELTLLPAPAAHHRYAAATMRDEARR